MQDGVTSNDDCFLLVESMAKQETDTPKEYVRQYSGGYLQIGYIDKVENQKSGFKSRSKWVVRTPVVVDIGAGMVRAGCGKQGKYQTIKATDDSDTDFDEEDYYNESTEEEEDTYCNNDQLEYYNAVPSIV